MKKKDHKVAVAYRIYPKIPNNPAIFHNSKYELAKVSLKSFKKSLGSLNVKIWALLDNCPLEYEDLFRQYFKDEELEIIKLEGIGNKASFGMQLKILLEQNFSEIVYFAEDDYFYFPNQFKKIISFIINDPEVDFISPYDHLDYYTLDLHKHSNYIKIFDNKHWRTANSTCCTFLTTKKTLQKTKKIFNLYSKGLAWDATIWLSLTKHKVFNLFTIARYYIQERRLFGYLKNAWKYCWKQILFGKRWKLWVPIPTIATHLDASLLSPTIDWEKIFKKYQSF